VIAVELKTPVYERASGAVRWDTLVQLTVEDDGGHQLEGEEPGLLDLEMPVISLRTGQQIRFGDEPQDWARSLIGAFRAGDLVAEVVHDDAPFALSSATDRFAAAR
jgi:hypothetical protein